MTEPTTPTIREIRKHLDAIWNRAGAVLRLIDGAGMARPDEAALQAAIDRIERECRAAKQRLAAAPVTP